MSTFEQIGNGRAADNVIDLFSHKPLKAANTERIIRISPEYDGLSMLYASHKTSSKLYAMRILCWGLRDNGEVVGMVPWLNKVVPCDELDDPHIGKYEAYYNTATEEIFYQAPPHKVMELETAADCFDAGTCATDAVMQEIPDTIGTHAMLNADDDGTIILTEVLSWKLLGSGHLQAMLIDEQKVKATPVLPGDPCLYPAEQNPDFRYFFQHHVANQIKSEDPEALAAIAMLFE